MKGLLPLCLLLGFAACSRGPQETPADRAAAAGILLRGNGQDPDSLDPHLATSVSAGNVLMNLFEGLTRLHPESLDAEGGIAERWQVSDDGLVWTFFLRESKWSNGEELGARDFLFAWRRMLHPGLAASYAYMLFPLKNAREIHSGELPAESLGVEAPDGRTLVLRLEKPTPYLPLLLAHWTWYPLHEASLADLGAVGDRTVLWTRPETMLVNGAFVLEEWIPENRLRLRRNPHYWQAEQVSLQGAEFIPVGDPATEERAFRSGQLHVTYSLPRQRLNHYRDRESGLLRMDPYLESVGWVINHRSEALGDARVRRAFSLAMNRAQIAEHVLGGTRIPAFHFVPPGLGGHLSPDPLREDLEAAAALLAEAGFPNGEGLPVFDLMLPNRQDWVRAAEVLQEQWARTGLRVQINSLERSTYFSRRREGRFDLCFLGWVGDYPDAMTFLGLWQSDAGNNFAGWRDEEYDRFLLASTASGADRNALLRAAEARILDDLPVIPLVFGSTQYLLDPRVRNWHGNLLDSHPLRIVEIGNAGVPPANGNAGVPPANANN